MGIHKLGTYAEFKEKVAKIIDDPFQAAKGKLEIKWIVGGREGGNCYNDGSTHNVTPELEPPFDSLDKVLEYFEPNITYLQYKRLLTELSVNEVENFNEFEYYGNETNYAIKSVSLTELYDYLFKLGAN